MPKNNQNIPIFNINFINLGDLLKCKGKNNIDATKTIVHSHFFVALLWEALGGKESKVGAASTIMSLLINHKDEPALSPNITDHSPSELWFW